MSRERGRRDSRERDSSRDRGATTSLLVRNLSYRVRPDEIRRIMSKHGEVRDVYIPQVTNS